MGLLSCRRRVEVGLFRLRGNVRSLLDRTLLDHSTFPVYMPRN